MVKVEIPLYISNSQDMESVDKNLIEWSKGIDNL